MGLFGGGSAPEVERNTLRANSIVRLLDLLCEGPIRGPVGGQRGIRFDGTPIKGADGRQNVQGVEVEFRNGSAVQAPLALVPQTEAAVDGLPQPMKQGAPVTKRITDPNAASLRIRIGYPEGLFRLDNSGDQRAVTVRYEIWIGSDGRDPSRYQECVEDGKTMAPFARDYEILLPGRPPWTVAMVRTSSDSTSNGSDQQTNWATTWDAATIIIGARLTYPHSAMLAYRIDTSKFGSTLPRREVLIDAFDEVPMPVNYDPVARTYAGLWLGGFKYGFTDNPAWIMLCILTHKRAGLGRVLDPALIDVGAFYQVAQYCDELVPDGRGGSEPRFQCSVVLDQARPAFDVLNDFASIFRGLTYYAAGAVSAVADGPRDPVKIITPANVIGGRITYSEAAEDARHSVIAAQWKDPAQDYKLVPETVEDGPMLRRYGYRRKTITAFAAATRGQARRAALWCLATEKWESGVAKFSAGIELAWLKPGDVIAIADPLVAGDRMGGRCRAITLSQLALDDQVLFAPGESYSIMVVMPDGSVAVRGLVAPDEHDGLVELDAPLDELPVDGAMFAITGTDVAPVQYRVINITEDEPHIFSFDVMRYERHKFAWIEQGVKFEPDPISRWVGELGAPTGLVATSVLYLAKDGVAARLELSWTPQDDPRIRAYEVEVQDPGTSAWRRDALTAQVSVVISSQAIGVYGLRVRAVADFQEPSAWTSITYSYGGLSDPPPDVGSIWASEMDDMLYLEWTPVLALDLDHYEIRAVAQDDQPIWERGNQLLTSLPPKTVAAALPLVPGIYLIKAVDTGGALSANAAYVRVTSDLTEGNLFDQITDVAPFNGERLNTRQSGNDLILVRGADRLFAPEGTYILDATIVQAAADPQPLRFGLDMLAVGRDPANVLAAWRPISRARPLGGVVSDQWSVQVQISTSADGVTWSAWSPMGFGYFRAKHYRFRATLSTGDTRITPAVERITINAYSKSA